MIDEGESPDEIAVIANKHSQLSDFIPYLEHEGVPYSYIRQASVFDEVHVKELITVCDYISSINNGIARKDELLPLILSFPYFHIDRRVLFIIAISELNFTMDQW